MTAHAPTGARPRRHAIALLMVFALILAACGSSGSSSSLSPTAAFSPMTTPTATQSADVGAAPVREAAAEPADRGTATANPADVAGLAVPTALTPTDIGRDIVFTASIDVEVSDVAAAGAEARDAVLALGGIVFGESTTTVGTPRTVLTFKVQPADFDKALRSIARIGDLVDQRVSADDVTYRIVDLQSRVTTAEASVVRLRKLLDQAGDINALAGLESQLLDRETLLEQLRGQLRTVRDQVALATITLTITQAATVIPPAAIDIIAGLGADTVEACPGSLDLTVDRFASTTLCVEIDNVGESPLTAIRLESGSLRLRLSDFTVVEGNVDRLDPGERLVVTTNLTVEDGRVRRRRAVGGLSIDLLASAKPVAAPRSTVDAATAVTLEARNDNPLPGFGDSFSAGASTLGFVAGIALIVFGGLLPFLPLLALLVVIFWWWHRRRWTRVEEPPAEQF